MKLGILKESHTQNAPQKKSSVVIAANLIRERVLLDANGNEIKNFKTKEIIRKAEEN